MGPPLRVACALLVLSLFRGPTWGNAAEIQNLGQPGFIVLEAARDPAAGFAWAAAPGPGLKSLVWEEGRLVIPDSLMIDEVGRHDIGFTCTRFLAGSGGSGQLVLRDGIFPVSEPIVLVDGPMQLRMTAGELEIRGAMIRYRRPVASPREFRSGLLMLAGMMLLVIVLLRRARLKSGERQDR